MGVEFGIVGHGAGRVLRRFSDVPLGASENIDSQRYSLCGIGDRVGVCLGCVVVYRRQIHRRRRDRHFDDCGAAFHRRNFTGRRPRQTGRALSVQHCIRYPDGLSVQFHHRQCLRGGGCLALDVGSRGVAGDRLYVAVFPAAGESALADCQCAAGSGGGRSISQTQSGDERSGHSDFGRLGGGHRYGGDRKEVEILVETAALSDSVRFSDRFL